MLIYIYKIIYEQNRPRVCGYRQFSVLRELLFLKYIFKYSPAAVGDVSTGGFDGTESISLDTGDTSFLTVESNE